MIASKEEFNELLDRLKAKQKENKLGKSLQTKLQAFLEVEELINLPISGVGKSFFCRDAGNTLCPYERQGGFCASPLDDCKSRYAK